MCPRSHPLDLCSSWPSEGGGFKEMATLFAVTWTHGGLGRNRTSADAGLQPAALPTELRALLDLAIVQTWIQDDVV